MSRMSPSISSLVRARVKNRNGKKSSTGGVLVEKLARNVLKPSTVLLYLRDIGIARSKLGMLKTANFDRNTQCVVIKLKCEINSFKLVQSYKSCW